MINMYINSCLFNFNNDNNMNNPVHVLEDNDKSKECGVCRHWGSVQDDYT